MVARLVFILAVAAALMFGGRAFAEPQEVRPTETGTQGAEERARALFVAGIDKIRDENWSEAERDLRASYELVQRASTLYNLALVVFKQGRFMESLALVSKLLETADPVADATHRQNATRLMERIGEQMAVVEITVAPSDASVFVDGHFAEGTGDRRRLIVEPGQHRLQVSRDGYATETMEMVLVGGKERMMEVELEVIDEPSFHGKTPPKQSRALAPPAQSSDRVASDSAESSIVPWFVIGAGGALLGAAVVTGTMAKRADDDFAEQCPDLHECDPDLQQLQDRAATLAVVTDVLLAGGGAAILGGLAWWYFTPKTAPQRGLRARALVTGERVELRLRSTF